MNRLCWCSQWARCCCRDKPFPGPALVPHYYQDKFVLGVGTPPGWGETGHTIRLAVGESAAVCCGVCGSAAVQPVGPPGPRRQACLESGHALWVWPSEQHLAATRFQCQTMRSVRCGMQTFFHSFKGLFLSLIFLWLARNLWVYIPAHLKTITAKFRSHEATIL